jgi:hypothetical protein
MFSTRLHPPGRTSSLLASVVIRSLRDIGRHFYIQIRPERSNRTEFGGNGAGNIGLGPGFAGRCSDGVLNRRPAEGAALFRRIVVAALLVELQYFVEHGVHRSVRIIMHPFPNILGLVRKSLYNLLKPAVIILDSL